MMVTPQQGTSRRRAPAAERPVPAAAPTPARHQTRRQRPVPGNGCLRQGHDQIVDTAIEVRQCIQRVAGMNMTHAVVSHDVLINELSYEAPRHGEVLIRVAAGSICGSDLYYYHAGGFGNVRLKEPLTLGHGPPFGKDRRRRSCYAAWSLVTKSMGSSMGDSIIHTATV